jgi:hypothetical protein
MFPYAEFKDTDLWTLIDEIVSELEANTDLELKTPREYVVGYFCKRLSGDRSLSNFDIAPKVKNELIGRPHSDSADLLRDHRSR